MNTKDWNPDLYNDKHSFVYEFGSNLIELLTLKNIDHVLNLGCGSGQLTNEISKHVKLVVGINKSPEVISDAKYKYPHIHFYVQDASTLDYTEQFDSIFSNATLH